MPRYYFDLHNATGADFDEEGPDLPDISAARRSARGCPIVAERDIRTGELDLRGHVTIPVTTGKAS